MNLYLTLFSRWWILTQLFWKRGELMVNLDLTILLKRWTEVKTWGGYVQDGLWRMHKTREVSFSTNSGFADLIEWYSLYFGSLLTSKMAAQNGCQRRIEIRKVTSLDIVGTRPCWMSSWPPTIVKFIDLFHLWPWPGTIERLNIVRIHTLFPFLPDLVQNISFFPVLTMVLGVILGSHLELYGQDSPKTQWILFYQIICDLRISRKRRLVCLYDPSHSRNITVHIFQYDVGGHARAAILDFNVKMVSEHR